MIPITESKADATGAETPAPLQPGQTQLRIGRLTKAHGLKGAIKVELYTDDPARRFTPGAAFQLQVPTSSPWHGKTIELIELKWYNTHAVAFFAGIGDRETAETLVKAILWVTQDATELPEEDDAWYDHQLVGLSVLRDGAVVGTVTQIDHLPAQDLLTISTPTGDVLVPFVKAIVPSVDVKAGTLTVTPPLGLFEEIEEEELPDEQAAGEQADAGDTSEAEIADEQNPVQPVDGATPDPAAETSHP